MNINEDGFIYSAYLLNDKNNIYIITSNFSSKGYYTDPIKLFDLKGKKIKEIKDSYYQTYYIDVYYDNKVSKIYIITGNVGYCTSYDYYENKIYHNYLDKNSHKAQHSELMININDKIAKLIESSIDGYIRIWDFNSGELLNKILVSTKWIFGFCLWNIDYILVGCFDKTIKIVDIKNSKVINELKGHNGEVINIKKINLPKFGECLISNGSYQEQIKIWR